MIGCVLLSPRTEPLGRSQLVGTEPAVQQLVQGTIPAEMITDLTWCRFIVFE